MPDRRDPHPARQSERYLRHGTGEVNRPPSGRFSEREFYVPTHQTVLVGRMIVNHRDACRPRRNLLECHRCPYSRSPNPSAIHMPKPRLKQLTYKDAGLDLKLYDQAMARLPALMEQTNTPRVMELPGGFAGLFRLGKSRKFDRNYNDPVLVSGTDGVGTKLKVASLA